MEENTKFVVILTEVSLSCARVVRYETNGFLLVIKQIAEITVSLI